MLLDKQDLRDVLTSEQFNAVPDGAVFEARFTDDGIELRLLTVLRPPEALPAWTAPAKPQRSLEEGWAPEPESDPAPDPEPDMAGETAQPDVTMKVDAPLTLPEGYGTPDRPAPAVVAGTERRVRSDVEYLTAIDRLASARTEDGRMVAAGHVSSGEIQGVLGLSSGAATQRMQNLAKRGLLKRRPLLGNRRGDQYSLSDAGRALLPDRPREAQGLGRLTRPAEEPAAEPAEPPAKPRRAMLEDIREAVKRMKREPFTTADVADEAGYKNTGTVQACMDRLTGVVVRPTTHRGDLAYVRLATDAPRSRASGTRVDGGVDRGATFGGVGAEHAGTGGAQIGDGFNKDIADLLRKARQAGCELKAQGNGHVLVSNARGKVTVPSTPSKVGTVSRIRDQLRKMGVKA